MLICKWSKIEPEGVASLTENAARMRMYRWMKRHKISFRVATHQAQGKAESQEVIKDFVDYIHYKVNMLVIPWSHVFNFDETNIYFSPEIKRTLARRGSRTVSVRKLDSASRCSAMLGCSAAGRKCSPFVIWKGSADAATGRIVRECRQPENYGLAPGIKYAVQEKAWMDEPTMLLDEVWKPIADSFEGPKVFHLG